MTQVIASQPTSYGQSNFRTAPNLMTFHRSDGNGFTKSNHLVQQIEEKRRLRQSKFPTLRGSVDVSSFQTNTKAAGFKRCNDEGDHRPPAPYRDYDNIIDPVSGFVSAGGDVDRNTGVSKLKPMTLLSDTPQANTPKQINSIRKSHSAAPPEIRREDVYEPGAPSLWDSRKISDIWIRSQLGGWTSDHDPRKTPQPELQRSKSMYVKKPPSEIKKEGRDHLAMKYLFSSSTQKAYGEVPWDSLLPPKIWAPTSTLEERPDVVSHRFSTKRYEPKAEEWQNTGRSWDRVQKRSGQYKQDWINFSSPAPRIQQIPLYGGSIGAENLGEVDNQHEPFQPYTVKRSEIPRPVETGHQPNIPGYTGSTLWRGKYAPAHTDPEPPINQRPSTASTHKSFPVTPNNSAHKRDSQMSKMITTVPPCNPFNAVNREDIVVKD